MAKNTNGMHEKAHEVNKIKHLKMYFRLDFNLVIKKTL